MSGQPAIVAVGDGETGRGCRIAVGADTISPRSADRVPLLEDPSAAAHEFAGVLAGIGLA